jgi:nucleoid-associated protein YgaU
MVSKLQSADHTKSRSIRRRERLDQIAAQEYGSSAEWRRIADENDIDDPRLVEPGTLLRLPPMRVGSVIGRSG